MQPLQINLRQKNILPQLSLRLNTLGNLPELRHHQPIHQRPRRSSWMKILRRLPVEAQLAICECSQQIFHIAFERAKRLRRGSLFALADIQHSSQRAAIPFTAASVAPRHKRARLNPLPARIS